MLGGVLDAWGLEGKRAGLAGDHLPPTGSPSTCLACMTDFFEQASRAVLGSLADGETY